MNIPKKIKIAGYKYKVKEVPDLNDGTHVLKGSIIYDSTTISINNSEWMGEQTKRETLLHEIIHGIIYRYGIDVSNINEEQLTVMLARGLYQVLIDNEKELFSSIDNTENK